MGTFFQVPTYLCKYPVLMTVIFQDLCNNIQDCNEIYSSVNFHLATFSARVCVLSRLTLSDPVDFSLPGSSAHGIFQARILE